MERSTQHFTVTNGLWGYRIRLEAVVGFFRVPQENNETRVNSTRFRAGSTNTTGRHIFET